MSRLFIMMPISRSIWIVVTMNMSGTIRQNLRAPLTPWTMMLIGIFLLFVFTGKKMRVVPFFFV